MPEPEPRCPRCGQARLRGAQRCRCNYVFTRGPVRGSSGQRGRRGPALIPTVVVVALAAAVVAAWLVQPAVETAHPSGATAGIMCLGGLFAVVASLLDADFFFASRRAWLILAVFGRDGARVVYALLGGGLVGAGVAMLG
jgi:hypothetical protein